MDRWLDDDEQRAWRALQFMHLRLDAALARQLAEDSELSYPDYLVLVALSDVPGHTLRLHALAGTLGWEKSRASHQVSRMERRGLVAKARCDDDRRGAFVSMTDRGRDALAEAAPGHADAVRRLFLERLSAEQLEVLAGAAEAVLAGFEPPPA